VIFDSIENYKLYTNVHPDFQAAFDFLLSANQNINDGKYILDGEKLIAHVMTKDTKLDGAAGLEYHKKYIDIQYVLMGEEICGLSTAKDTKHSVPYDQEKDIAFLSEDKDTITIKVTEGYFYIVWPHEPHRPLCAIDKCIKEVKKIVIKVAV